jgi:low temperature requirement protein LtrA
MLAAGIPDLFDDGQSGLVVAGYAVMRLAMVAFWLRAAGADEAGRSTALRYAVGIAAVQLFWIWRLVVEDQAWRYGTFAIGIVLELLVPVVAERGRRTPHHPHHITERYALFTIIVLGEVILASVQAVQGALESGVTGDLLGVMLGGLLVVYSLWWIYFKRDHLDLFEGPLRDNFVAGYGHFAVFASVAATGAALAASVDLATHEAHASPRLVGLALAGAITVYVLTLGVFHAIADRRAGSATSALVTAGSVVVVALLGPSIGITVLLIGLVLAAAVAQHVWSTSTHVDGVARPS